MHSQTELLAGFLCADKVEMQQSVTIKVNECEYMVAWSWTPDILSLRANIVDEICVLFCFQVFKLSHWSYINTDEIIYKTFLLSAISHLLPSFILTFKHRLPS